MCVCVVMANLPLLCIAGFMAFMAFVAFIAAMSGAAGAAGAGMGAVGAGSAAGGGQCTHGQVQNAPCECPPCVSPSRHLLQQ